jgi:rhamnogalacturonyl hydrolase YesR
VSFDVFGSSAQTGTSQFWSRSIGWYAMALVDVLDYFPKEHPKQKELVGAECCGREEGLVIPR